MRLRTNGVRLLARSDFSHCAAGLPGKGGSDARTADRFLPALCDKC